MSGARSFAREWPGGVEGPLPDSRNWKWGTPSPHFRHHACADFTSARREVPLFEQKWLTSGFASAQEKQFEVQSGLQTSNHAPTIW